MFENFSLFKRTSELESKIDQFFDKLAEASVIYRLAVRGYLREGVSEEFKERLDTVGELETQADSLRRDIEQKLYKNILIPDSRGDVLGLIETADDVLVSGETNLMGVPEFNEIQKLRGIFDAFKAKNDLLDLLERSVSGEGINIFIGEESGYEALTDCSVVTAPYDAGNQNVGVIGVIGPTRMAYESVVPVVDITAKLLSSALSYQEN